MVTMGFRSFPGGSALKNPLASAGDMRDTGLIPGSGIFPGGGHGNPLQYSCLENPLDRGAWRATVYGVAKTWTWLKRLSTHTQRAQSALGMTVVLGSASVTLVQGFALAALG